MSNSQVNNRLLDVLVKLLAHHVQREKAYQASLPQTDDAFWELDKQARDEFLAKQSPIDWETTPWQRAVSFLSEVFSTVVPKDGLRVHIAASKIGLDESDSLSVELVRLDREGATDKLISVIQDEFPNDAGEMGLAEYLEEDLPVLSELASVVYEILLSLPEYKGLTGPKLLAEMDKKEFPSDQSTLTSRIIPELKPYGVENVPRKGYRIIPRKRPKL